MDLTPAFRNTDGYMNRVGDTRAYMQYEKETGEPCGFCTSTKLQVREFRSTLISFTNQPTPLSQSEGQKENIDKPVGMGVLKNENVDSPTL